jgi:signal peptidase I
MERIWYLFGIICPGISFVFQRRYKIYFSISLIFMVVIPAFFSKNGLFNNSDTTKLFFAYVYILGLVILLLSFFTLKKNQQLFNWKKKIIILILCCMQFLIEYQIILNVGGYSLLYVYKKMAMEPTVEKGDILMTTKNVSNILRGDIIAFKAQNKKLLIKRVVGLPGERIKLIGGKLYVNNNIVEEPYIKEGDIVSNSADNFYVKTNSYFVLGDNRSKSYDSRHFGLVHKNNITSKILFNIYD